MKEGQKMPTNKYPSLQEPCKSMLDICGGCNRLELLDFTHDWNCRRYLEHKNKNKYEQLKIETMGK